MNFDKICDFLLADTSDRLHWVRDLTLAGDIFGSETSLYQYDLKDGDNIKFEWVPVFLEILQLANNLRRLSLSGTEVLLKMEPAIGDAFVALPELTSLELNHAGSHTIRMLARLQSTVRHLIVHHDTASDTGRTFYEYLTHGVTFPGVETIEFGDLDSEPYPLTTKLYLDRQWPNVRHLTLSQGCFISLSTCTRLFPGIRSLHLKSAPGYDPHGVLLWPNLDLVRVQGRLTVISFPVHYLKLRDDSGEWYKSPCILKVIQAPSPVVLSIRARAPLNDLSFWIALLQCAPRLRCLDIIMIYDYTVKDRLCKWIEDISDVFASSRLLCIRIRIHDWFCELSDIHFLLPSLEHFARVVHPLQYLAFGLGNLDYLSKARLGRFRGKTWWWRVSICEERRSIEAILRESGKHILAAIRSADFGDGKNLDGMNFVRPSERRCLTDRSGGDGCIMVSAAGAPSASPRAGLLLLVPSHLSLLRPNSVDSSSCLLRPPFRGSKKWNARTDAVRQAYLHAYAGYKKFAGTSDELLPLSDGSVNNFNGWGVTLIDGLDTMWIMGLHEEFYEAIPIVANMTFAQDTKSYAPFFETVIRYLGGLLSAYALSGEPILLTRADDLGRMLLPALNTTSGLPMYAVNTVTGETREGWTHGTVLWAEALSCQLEYKYLAHLTGRREYFEDVERIMDIMRDAQVTDGMFPTRWNLSKGTPMNSHFSVGAFADSAHEYLLKQWLLTSKSEPKARDLYLRAATSIIESLLYITPNRNLLYVTDTTGGSPSHTFEHLSCFLPGLLALGAHTLGLPPHEREVHAWAARGLAYTCWITYADQASGLGPDEVRMEAIRKSEENPHGGLWVDHLDRWILAGRQGGVPPGLVEVPMQPRGHRDYSSRKAGYYLRPEAVESFYIMWRTTGDEVWRERGWAVFQAIEREAKTDSGYASLLSVDESPASLKNEMPRARGVFSFFMAET
ncbi:hypothetical protein IEO21_07552 [Rhodonia placenta]|uniref:alpha-1,2-Mannosidase n=1 Tax=Rhodonia placenta TaxID=104341 RepID=A0A8H7NXX1_9APHY|nr:hypothetical protein IEO21_07552 [Postia placenta]